MVLVSIWAYYFTCTIWGDNSYFLRAISTHILFGHIIGRIILFSWTIPYFLELLPYESCPTPIKGLYLSWKSWKRMSDCESIIVKVPLNDTRLAPTYISLWKYITKPNCNKKKRRQHTLWASFLFYNIVYFETIIDPGITIKRIS